MRTDSIVVSSPCFDHDLGLLQGVEDLAVQQLVTQLAIEALAVAVLPWAAWLDVGRFRPHGFDPVAERLGDELRPVVGTDVGRHPAKDEQVRESIDHIGRSQSTGYPNGQGFAGELVDDAQHSVCLALVGAIRNEVVRPDMIGMLRPQADARAIIEPKPPPLRLLRWHLQPLTPPDPCDPLPVDPPAGSAQQRGDPAVAVAAILAGEVDNLGS